VANLCIPVLILLLKINTRISTLAMRSAIAYILRSGDWSQIVATIVKAHPIDVIYFSATRKIKYLIGHPYDPLIGPSSCVERLRAFVPMCIPVMHIKPLVIFGVNQSVLISGERNQLYRGIIGLNDSVPWFRWSRHVAPSYAFGGGIQA
jgi:hypothetical protein